MCNSVCVRVRVYTTSVSNEELMFRLERASRMGTVN